MLHELPNLDPNPHDPEEMLRMSLNALLLLQEERVENTLKKAGRDYTARKIRLDFNYHRLLDAAVAWLANLKDITRKIVK